MPLQKWTAEQDATGEGVAVLQACAEYISNKSSGRHVSAFLEVKS